MKRRTQRAASGTISVLGALALSTSLVGVAAPPGADAPVDSLAAIVPAAVETTASDIEVSSDGATAIVDDTTVVLPRDPEDGISVDTGEASFTIEVPSAHAATGTIDPETGIATYDNHDGSSTVAIVNEDSSTSLHTIIEGSDSPKMYSYEYSGDAHLTQLPDGGIVVIDGEDKLVASIAEPWARDARGNPVSTRYIVDGNTLTQVVEHGRGSAYPIVADPTTLGSNSFYSKIVQNSSAQGTIISVYPAQIKWTAYSGDTMYANYKAIVPAAYEGNKWRDQLVCHAVNVGVWKSPWNLDSWRPDVGYTRTVLAACNPS